MPNLVVANNPEQAGFLGDYMWVSLDRDGHPLVVWTDTRGLNDMVEEDIYFAKPLILEFDHKDDNEDDNEEDAVELKCGQEQEQDQGHRIFLPFTTLP